MSIEEVVKTERVTRFVRREEWHEGRHMAGYLLTMQDGTKWFHPFDGSKPLQEKN